MAHDRDCRFSPLFPHCNCGEVERTERLEQLEDERKAIQRLIEGAETVTIEGVGQPYTPKVVYARDLEDVLAGRLR
jgi:hypothetical protein